MTDTKTLDVCEVCKAKKVMDPVTGKGHLEWDCPDSETAQELAELHKEESIIHIRPKVAIK
jgi:hypothetical protein